MKPNLWLLAGALVLQATFAAAAPVPAPRPAAARPAVVPKPGPCVPRPLCAPPSPSPSPAPAVCSSIQVWSNPARDPSAVPTFSATDILDVNFTIRFRNGAAVPATMVMNVFTPNGHLYQETAFPITQGAVGVNRMAPGRHFPMKAARVSNTNGRRSVAAPPLPMAGTPISQSSLYGTWRVTATAPGNPKGCSARFTVEP